MELSKFQMNLCLTTNGHPQEAGSPFQLKSWGLTAEVREGTPGVRDTTKGLKEGDSWGGNGGDEEC